MKNITKIADEILSPESPVDPWFGPTGKCWCEEQGKYISPSKDLCKDCKNCSECQPLGSTDERVFRYLHLTDNYRSASMCFKHWYKKNKDTKELRKLYFEYREEIEDSGAEADEFWIWAKEYFDNLDI